MSTETPRTDPFIFEIDMRNNEKFPVLDAEVSREIELDLKAANAKIKELQSLNDIYEVELVKLHDIALDIYNCYHVSEKPNMYSPVIRAWDVGKEVYESMENERTKYNAMGK